MLRRKGGSLTSGNCTLRDEKEPMVFWAKRWSALGGEQLDEWQLYVEGWERSYGRTTAATTTTYLPIFRTLVPLHLMEAWLHEDPLAMLDFIGSFPCSKTPGARFMVPQAYLYLILDGLIRYHTIEGIVQYSFVINY
jgi:hypothetical protein